MSESYDDRQIRVPLRVCLVCQQPYYMKSAICGKCGPGWRTEQRPTPSRLDVNGVEMNAGE